MARIGFLTAAAVSISFGFTLDRTDHPPEKPAELADAAELAPTHSQGTAQEQEADKHDEVDRAKRVAVEPKPLSQSVIKGLDWLIAQQHSTGGWGQGEESARMPRPQGPGGGQELRDRPNVADTAMATLALVRSGSTPSEGPYSTSILRAVEFVCEEIEQADDESLSITSVRGTRVQGKIGPYIDTFLAALLLAEVKDHMPSEQSAERVMAALKKTTDKIERHQDADGQWAGRAWAGGLSNAFAVKAINRLSQAGVPVDEDVRQRAMFLSQSLSQTRGDGRFADDGRSAGIELYAAARAVGELNDAVQTNVLRQSKVEQEKAASEKALSELEQALEKANGDDEANRIKVKIAEVTGRRARAETELNSFAAADADLVAARGAIAKRLTDDRFVAGFGTNGGEEFISYLNIGETLVIEGGEAWEEFDQRMTANLTRVQNDDGSWTGHHCITGRTFCTASALLVLMVDRSPNPIMATLSRK